MLTLCYAASLPPINDTLDYVKKQHLWSFSFFKMLELVPFWAEPHFPRLVFKVPQHLVEKTFALIAVEFFVKLFTFSSLANE